MSLPTKVEVEVLCELLEEDCRVVSEGLPDEAPRVREHVERAQRFLHDLWKAVDEATEQ